MSSGAARSYAQKIRSTAQLSKVFRAQELIASSRIQAARQAQAMSVPYAEAITTAVGALVTHNPDIDHALTRPRLDNRRVAVFVLSSDRGMAGSYSGGIIRECEGLLTELGKAQPPKTVDLYVAGRRAVSFYHYRHRELAGEWVYGSDHPTDADAVLITNTLLETFLRSTEEGGVGEVYVVYTKFINLVSQEPKVVRILPLSIVEAEKTAEMEGHGNSFEYPLYDFEPSEKLVLDALLPRYVAARIRSFMLESAASEVAARQRAMHTAVDNSRVMIEKYTRMANAARQSDITQEITEIVSGANALAENSTE
ncbi:MAG: F0F1 ATP synthase subunit gamma [Promicromonosporaceae bacterium]|nr:F0F1 ATP synthase subunit gamma [Promicromonosporaceae bacterium]